jgi:Rv2632c-like
MHTRTWTVTVQLSEEGAVTKARAVLSTDDTEGRLHGEGTAFVHPGEPSVPEIGDEIAASRALAALSHALLDAALEDVQGVLQKV